MNIGQPSAASGVPAEMLRYHEGIGLIPRAGRTEAGYRVYTDAYVQTLRFVRRGRDLGLSTERIKLLVGLWRDRERSSADVKRVATARIAELEAKIRGPMAMRATSQELADACHGDGSPECPILRDLEGGGAKPRTAPAGRERGAARVHAAAHC